MATMNVDNDEKVQKIDIMHPEILTTDGVKELLLLRKCQSIDLDMMDRDELMQLYYKTVLPLPQRSYRKNRRGKLMVQKQRVIDRKRKRNIDDEEEDVSPKRSRSKGSLEVDTTEKLLGSFTLDSPQTRCKPIDLNRKVVKLNSTKSQKNSLDHIVIKSRNKSSESKSDEPKIISLKKTVTSEFETAKSGTIICLNRDKINEFKKVHENSTSNNSTSNTKSEENMEIDNSDISTKRKSEEKKVTKGSSTEDVPKRKIKLKRITFQ